MLAKIIKSTSSLSCLSVHDKYPCHPLLSMLIGATHFSVEK
jgi:hypothetical protein